MTHSTFAPLDTPSLQPSLEDLLSVRAAPGGGVLSAATDLPADPGAPPLLPLLLVHTGSSANPLLMVWMQRVLQGHLPHVCPLPGQLQQVQHLQPQALLIEFEPGTLDAAVALCGAVQAQFPDLTYLAIGRTQHPHCVLAALRAGVQDFLDIDGPLDVTQQVLHKLLAQPRPQAAQPPQPLAPRTAILSARAGLGCSVLAAHLAWYLQQQLAPAPADPGSVPADAPEAAALTALLVELGSPGGDCAIYLNTPGEFSFSDAVQQQRRLDTRMAHSALARHDSGLRLLPQPYAAQPLPSSDVQALLVRLGQYFSHIVCDLGADTPPALLADLLPQTQDIWVVCDQNVVSVVWTMDLLRQLETLGVQRSQLQLIINRHDSALALDAQQVARQLQLPLLAVLPERRRELANAVNHGKLLAPQHRRDPYVQALRQLSEGLIAQHHPAVAARPAPATGLLSGLLQRIRRS